MDSERLKTLAEAYGADMRLWPEAEREAARAWKATYPDEAERLLFDAAQTDAALAASHRAEVSQALRDRVLEAAYAACPPGRRGWSLAELQARFGGRWLSGAGWAAAACAGVVFGQVMVGQMTADIQADAILYQASLTVDDETEVFG